MPLSPADVKTNARLAKERSVEYKALMELSYVDDVKVCSGNDR